MLTIRELRAVVTTSIARRRTRDPDAATDPPVARASGPASSSKSPSRSTACCGRGATRRARSQYRSDGQFEITIKAHPHGLVSQWLHANARTGLVLGLAAGRRRLHVARAASRPHVLVSGGSGITPVLSMLRTLCDEGLRRGGRVPALRVRPRGRRPACRDRGARRRARQRERALRPHRRPTGISTRRTSTPSRRGTPRPRSTSAGRAR